MQDIESKRFWWFGINNLKNRNPESFNHVIYPEILPFLKGEVDTFSWPRQIQHHQDLYDKFELGDSVLLWMGDGDYPNWGIIGFAYIAQIKKGSFRDRDIYLLKKKYVPEKSLLPYEKNNRIPSEITKFFYEIFGKEFKPLWTTYRNIGMKNKKAPPITIEKIYKSQFEKILDYAKSNNYI